jgi:fructose-bisphosphate aldolase, class I
MAFTEELKATTQAILAVGKGILAGDESLNTENQRFEKFGIPQTMEMRQEWRRVLFTTPGIGAYLSGVILFDETIHQATQEGVLFTTILQDTGIISGIKLDKGTQPFVGRINERITDGLDGLRDRIAEYYRLGARFAKWRGVISIGKTIPSTLCIETNANALAHYAALCQEGGLVPIVEPEVLMNGNHTIDQSLEVHQAVLNAVFDQLYHYRVALDQMILKPSMVIAGTDCPQQATIEAVAQATVKCLRDQVPATVAGCAFLSGGQSDALATAHLNAMNVLFKDKLPWILTFSYGRALQQSAMNIWMGKESNVRAAQEEFFHRAQLNSLASIGQYNSEMETVTAQSQISSSPSFLFQL